MYIRCADCLAATWIQTLGADAGGTSVVCKSCGQDYTLPDSLDLGSAKDQYRLALAFAEENSIGLPSAYSVLLGIMSLEAALELADSNVLNSVPDVESTLEPLPEPVLVPAHEAKVVTSRPVPVPGVSPVYYDPAFREAVEQGLLTAEQAKKRGSREAWATRLAARHEMPKSLALAVADNRIETSKAIAEARQRHAEKEGGGEPGLRLPGTRTLVMAGFLVVVLAIIVGFTRKPTGSVEKAEKLNPLPTIQTFEQAEVHTSPENEVFRITAPDPIAVLGAYCRSAAPAGELEAIRVADTTPPSMGARFGIFRDTRKGGGLFAIQINKDRGSGAWVAGYGRGPIAAVAAPPELLAQTPVDPDEEDP